MKTLPPVAGEPVVTLSEATATLPLGAPLPKVLVPLVSQTPLTTFTAVFERLPAVPLPTIEPKFTSPTKRPLSVTATLPTVALPPPGEMARPVGDGLVALPTRSVATVPAAPMPIVVVVLAAALVNWIVGRVAF